VADERESGRDRPSQRPDPSFLDRLADDAEWREYESSRSERRADRHRQSGARRGSRGRSGSPRTEGRRRLLALMVLVAVVVVVAVVGLEAGTSESDAASGQSSPFHLLPLDTEAVTSTVSTEPPSTTAPADDTSTSESTTSATSTTSP